MGFSVALRVRGDGLSIADAGGIECPGRWNFLGISESWSRPETSLFHLLPVPYDGTATYMPGARMGPRAVIEASRNIEIYDHDLDLEAARAGIATYPEMEIQAGGPERMVAATEREVSGILARGGLPVLLGGEHSVSIGAVRAVAAGGGGSVVALDAHADLRDTYQGSPYSHACFLRRALEIADCSVFGVRSISRGEMDFARGGRARVEFADRIKREGVDALDLDGIGDRIYLSVDVDVFDPSVIPATGTPEPGGLDWYEVDGLLRRVIKGREVLGFDVVELCPQPGNPAPDFTVARLVYRLMGMVLKFSANPKEDWICHGEAKNQEEKGGQGRG
jgi:agmatinase